MVNILVNWILSAFCLYLLSFLFSGISFTSFKTALIAAIVLGLVNAFIKPVLSILSLPINILTLGLFSLVINALMLYLTSNLISGFKINSFGTAFFAAIVLSLLNMVFINFK